MNEKIKVIVTDSIKMDYDFFRKNIVTSREACELLGISRQQLFNFVKKGSLKPLIHEKAFALFLRKDVMSLKYYMPFNASTRIIDDSATVQQSIEFFKYNIDKLDRIESIFVFKYKFDSATNGFFIPDDYVGIGELRYINSPHLVIRDTKGRELWLLNCSCDDNDEISKGLKSILQELRDKHNLNLDSSNLLELSNTISEYQIIYIRFSLNGDVETTTKTSECKPDDRNKALCIDEKEIRYY